MLLTAIIVGACLGIWALFAAAGSATARGDALLNEYEHLLEESRRTRRQPAQEKS